ncbi:MAG: DJ-1/PfpI family protein [Deltaproteobacteria bacterium]|nr:DJ-1/PfpI family protein [Deltaproteobacteria bacterium]
MTRILIITGDGSTPDLDYAVFRMREEGFDVTIAAPKKKRLHVVIHQQEPGWDTYVERPWYAMESDASFDEVDPSTFDGLLLPGGRAPEHIRNIDRCVELVRHFVETNKPIGAICRGPLVLLEAGVKGRRLTGNSLIKPRVAMRGAIYVESRGEAVVDGNIVTVNGRPYYHVWIRTFLSMLRGTPVYTGKEAFNSARILMIIEESTSSGHHDYAYFRMLEEGYDVTVAAPVKKPLRTVVHMPFGLDGTWDTFQELPGFIIEPDASLAEIDPSAFAALAIPGGRGPEHLRVDQRCLDIVRHFIQTDKPMAFICHSPQILTEALASLGIKGKRLTAIHHSVKADVIAAGCIWVQTRDAVVDGNIVTTGRRPDYDVWMRAFVNMLNERGINKAKAAESSAFLQAGFPKETEAKEYVAKH